MGNWTPIFQVNQGNIVPSSSRVERSKKNGIQAPFYNLKNHATQDNQTVYFPVTIDDIKQCFTSTKLYLTTVCNSNVLHVCVYYIPLTTAARSSTHWPYRLVWLEMYHKSQNEMWWFKVRPCIGIYQLIRLLCNKTNIVNIHLPLLFLFWLLKLLSLLQLQLSLLKLLLSSFQLLPSLPLLQTFGLLLKSSSF